MVLPLRAVAQGSGQARLLAVVAAVAVTASASSGSHHAAGSTTLPSPGVTTTGPTTTTATLPPGPLKPALQGIIEINQLPTGAELPVAGGVALSVTWKELQPTRGGPIASNNSLDQTISAIRAITQAQHLNLGIRFRVLAGINAPDWAKSLAGAPVTVVAAQGGESGTVGQFWTDPFGQAYADLERKLAAEYDTVPEVREVTASRCTTIFAEPLLRQATEPVTVSNLAVAGYTDAADDRCQHQMIDAHQVWRHTRTGMAFNPYQHPGGNIQDTAGTLRFMAYCRQVLGPRCVVENNSIRYPPISNYVPMYQAMKQMGAPISFQTAGPNRIGSLPQTLTWAAAQGANAVELSPGMMDSVLGLLPQVVQTLRANPTGPA
jgi:hypothetical protein